MLRLLPFAGPAVTAVALLAGAPPAQAQGASGSRDNLLDAVTRHIQICNEIADTQQRLSCYDRLQTQVGGVSPAPSARPAPTPIPTPIQPSPPVASSTMPPAGQPTPSLGQPTPLAPPPGTSIGGAPLPPQPLGVPGGGVATMSGSTPSISGGPSPAGQDPDAAFDPRRAVPRTPENLGPRPQPLIRRTGPRPIPYASTPQPLVALGANNLTYGDARYWQVSVTLTSNTPRPVTAQAQCTFLNGGRPVSTDNLGPLTLQPGEQVSTELVGPPTTTYVDSTNCRVVSP